MLLTKKNKDSARKIKWQNENNDVNFKTKEPDNKKDNILNIRANELNIKKMVLSGLWWLTLSYILYTVAVRDLSSQFGLSVTSEVAFLGLALSFITLFIMYPAFGKHFLWPKLSLNIYTIGFGQYQNNMMNVDESTGGYETDNPIENNDSDAGGDTFDEPSWNEPEGDISNSPENTDEDAAGEEQGETITLSESSKDEPMGNTADSLLNKDDDAAGEEQGETIYDESPKYMDTGLLPTEMDIARELLKVKVQNRQELWKVVYTKYPLTKDDKINNEFLNLLYRTRGTFTNDLKIVVTLPSVESTDPEVKKAINTATDTVRDIVLKDMIKDMEKYFAEGIPVKKLYDYMVKPMLEIRRTAKVENMSNTERDELIKKACIRKVIYHMGVERAKKKIEKNPDMDSRIQANLASRMVGKVCKSISRAEALDRLRGALAEKLAKHNNIYMGSTIGPND